MRVSVRGLTAASRWVRAGQKRVMPVDLSKVSPPPGYAGAARDAENGAATPLSPAILAGLSIKGECDVRKNLDLPQDAKQVPWAVRAPPVHARGAAARLAAVRLTGAVCARCVARCVRGACAQAKTGKPSTIGGMMKSLSGSFVGTPKATSEMFSSRRTPSGARLCAACDRQDAPCALPRIRAPDGARTHTACRQRSNRRAQSHDTTISRRHFDEHHSEQRCGQGQCVRVLRNVLKMFCAPWTMRPSIQADTLSRTSARARTHTHAR